MSENNLERIQPMHLEQEMKKSFIAYAMAVIIDRALPDVHGLQAVAHIGQRTRHDNRHRIVDISRLHLLLYIDGNYLSLQSGILFFFSQHV